MEVTAHTMFESQSYKKEKFLDENVGRNSAVSREFTIAAESGIPAGRLWPRRMPGTSGGGPEWSRSGRFPG